MRFKPFAFILAFSVASVATKAQQTFLERLGVDRLDFGKHLDIGVTLGTTGFGVDVATPITDYARLRTGFSYVPKIEVPMTFGVQVGNDPATSQSKFNKMSGYLSNLTGYHAKSEVETLGRPNFWNWDVMVDVFPLKNNRHWHVTVGFFVGPSKVAEAYNKTESMASLMSVNIYNNLYDKLHGLSIRELLKVQIFDFPGLEDFGTDPDVLIELQRWLDNNGRMGIWMGKYKTGGDYIMDPDENCMVKVDMKVNTFKPYLGVGYDGRMLKNEDRLKIGFDAGIMLWGGTPHLITHDGTDLIHDVKHIPGKVGDYVGIIKQFEFFPLLNLRLAYNIF